MSLPWSLSQRDCLEMSPLAKSWDSALERTHGRHANKGRWVAIGSRGAVGVYNAQAVWDSDNWGSLFDSAQQEWSLSLRLKAIKTSAYKMVCRPLGTSGDEGLRLLIQNMGCARLRAVRNLSRDKQHVQTSEMSPPEIRTVTRRRMRTARSSSVGGEEGDARHGYGVKNRVAALGGGCSGRGQSGRVDESRRV
ncbi:hypothetical protein BDW22DRAFT_1349356 [Trametopsis cervina]|nr:hypothetical protein BDW22DRAFT_1349356 [Trametopsis cervina]